MTELLQRIDIEERKTSEEDLEDDIELLKETPSPEKEEVDLDFLIGKDIVENARRIDPEDFLDITQETFQYDGPDLAEDLGPKFLQAKRRLLIHDKDLISRNLAQSFYTNFLSLLLEKKFLDFFEQDAMEDLQLAGFHRENPKNFFPDLVVGSFGFSSKGKIEEAFTRCPRQIVEFKQGLIQGRKGEDYESVEFATEMARCVSNYGHLDPPKYLVGILFAFDGAEVFIIETKSIRERRVSEGNVIRTVFEWDLKIIEEVAKAHQRRDEEIEETCEMVSCVKRNSTTELNAERFQAFEMLFDFMLSFFD